MEELESPVLENVLNTPTRSFDQRLSSKLSVQHQSPVKLAKSHLLNLDLESALNPSSNNHANNTRKSLSSLQWMKLSKISDQIYSTESRQENGDPDFMIINDEYIAIATTKCNILFFNYKQTRLLKVKAINIAPTTRITSMSLSIDSTYIVVGYSSGLVSLWDLKKTDPIISIRPVTSHELQYNGTHHNIAHVDGTPVRRISFIGSRHTGFISSDDSGVIILHNGVRSLIGYHCRSKIIFGDYTLSNILNDKIDYTGSVLDFHLLPVGSKKDITDKMGLLSIITSDTLIIMSIHPNIKTLFKIPKPQKSKLDTGLSALTSWYPATIDNTEKIETLPSLGYCWSNNLYVSEFQPKILVDEYGEEIPVLTMVNKREFKYNESIVSLHWLNRNILIIFTRSNKLLFLNSKNLKLLKEVDLMAKEVKFNSIYNNNKIGLIEKSYFGSIHTLKSNIFIFQNKTLVIGNLYNWADTLLHLLEEGKYIEALEESKRQYEGDEDMPLLSLPENNKLRHEIMNDCLLKILKSSLKYIFNIAYEVDSGIDFRMRILLSIQTCLTINAPSEFYDLIYEKLTENNLENLFFEVIESFILNSKITTFSPTILRAMVSYYVEENDISTLEQLICLLDIEQLDIDLTVSLCREYHLNEILTYIWTSLLHDYLTPLVDAINKIKEYNENIDTLSDDEIRRLENDINYIFPYVSYTLTGRQYPTDKMLPAVDNPGAKLTIYDFLFDGSTISWPKGSCEIHIFDDYSTEPAYPYLYVLLKYSSSSIFSCLNEAFEDDLLNDNDAILSGLTNDEKGQLKINRQYIIDVLLGIFHDQDFGFKLIDHIQLAIFISRNYPKYLQFIRIADSIADKMLDLLCQTEHLSDLSTEFLQDCELALQSLLAVYKPIDMDILMIKVEKAEYYQVLLTLYQSEERYFDVLNLWVKLQKSDKDKSKSILFKSVDEIIKDSLEHIDSVERQKMIKLMSDNFELFVKSNPKNIAIIINEICPELNSQVVNFKDSRIKFEYLREIFNRNEHKKKFVNLRLSEDLKVEYLNALISQRTFLLETIHEIDNDTTVDKTTKLKSLADKIKSFVFTLSTLDKVIINLLQDDNLETIIDWYVNKNDYQTAIDKICEIMENLSKQLENEGYNSKKETKLWECVELSFSVLTHLNNSINKSVQNMTTSENLLLKVVELSVKMFTTIIKSESIDNKVVDIFKRIVQSTFQYIINLSQEDPKLFNTIFEKFLDGSSVHITTLGDIRTVLKEVFLSYSNDKKILTLIQTLVDGDIFEDLQVLETLKLKGRTPRNIECESCSKKIWGGRVGNSVYESWRDTKLKDVIKDIEINDKFNITNELFIFKCKHTYHRKCLENLGMVKDEEKKCIICNS